jgi:hypothetical protein
MAQEPNNPTPQPTFDELVLKTFGMSPSDVAAKLNAPAPSAPEPTFAAPFIAQVNKMVENGEPMDNVHKFMSIATMDVQKMPETDAVLGYLQTQYPMANRHELDVLYKSQYHAPDEADEAAKLSVAAKRIAAASEHKLKLQKQKDQFKVPEYVSKAQQQAQQQAQAAMWEPILNDKLDKISVKPLKLEVKKDGFGEWNTDFPLNFDADMRSKLKQRLQQTASKLGNPDTEKSQALEGRLLEIVKAEQFQAILDKAVQDAFADGQQYALQARSNPNPPGNGSGQKPAKKEASTVPKGHM